MSSQRFGGDAFNNGRLLELIDDMPPAEFEALDDEQRRDVTRADHDVPGGATRADMTRPLVRLGPH